MTSGTTTEAVAVEAVVVEDVAVEVADVEVMVKEKAVEVTPTITATMTTGMAVIRRNVITAVAVMMVAHLLIIRPRSEVHRTAELMPTTTMNALARAADLPVVRTAATVMMIVAVGRARARFRILLRPARLIEITINTIMMSRIAHIVQVARLTKLTAMEAMFLVTIETPRR